MIDGANISPYITVRGDKERKGEGGGSKSKYYRTDVSILHDRNQNKLPLYDTKPTNLLFYTIETK